MVRRWSYLNLINTTFSSEHNVLAFVHHYATFKATTYYRKSIYRTTRLSRRAWSRRKHLHNWLLYQNLLANWSQDYLFFRKYSRSVLALNVFKNSYLTYNLLMFRKLAVTDFLGSENVMISSIIRRIIRYCSRLNSSTYAFFNSYRGVAWMYVTTNLQLDQTRESSLLVSETTHLAYRPACYIAEGGTELTPLLAWFQTLLTIMFNHALLKSVELYKLITLLTLSTLS